MAIPAGLGQVVKDALWGYATPVLKSISHASSQLLDRAGAQIESNFAGNVTREANDLLGNLFGREEAAAVRGLLEKQDSQAAVEISKLVRGANLSNEAARAVGSLFTLGTEGATENLRGGNLSRLLGRVTSALEETEVQKGRVSLSDFFKNRNVDFANISFQGTGPRQETALSNLFQGQGTLAGGSTVKDLMWSGTNKELYKSGLVRGATIGATYGVLETAGDIMGLSILD